MNFGMSNSVLKIAFLAFILVRAVPANAGKTPEYYGRLSVDSPSEVTPQGWIREYLQRQLSGLSGHPEVMSYPYNTDLWKGTIKRMSTHGKEWWRYEQTAYYSDGLLRLGYLLADEGSIKKIEDGIDYTLKNASKEGLLGDPAIYREEANCLWPMVVYSRAMRAMYEKTGDGRIIDALEKFYLANKSALITKGRNIVSVEGMLWTYGKCGNRALLDLAEEAYSKGGFELSPDCAGMDGCVHLHGVTYCEELKVPAILYLYTGKEEYRQIALSLEDKLVRYNMLPSGVPSSAEFLMGNSVENAHETCDIADFTWTESYFLKMTGDPMYADHIEKAIFNAAPGAITKDFKAIQYFSNMNQFNVCGDSDPNPYVKGQTRHAYRSIHQTECCVGNVHRIMPNYVYNMWMTDARGGITAALYGPSRIKTEGITIDEQTSYPFDEDIRFVFHCDKPCRKTFSLRIPLWCGNAVLKINGKQKAIPSDRSAYVKLNRCWKEGDVVELHLDMPVRITHPAGQGVSYERGPLLFSYSIPTKWTPDEVDHPDMRGKKCVNPDFKCWNLTADGPFGYAVDCLGGELVRNEVPEGSYPFENPPFSIKIPVREIEWKLVEDKYTPAIPPINVRRLSNDEKTIELIPYGCTQLRLTVFPKIGDKRLVEGLY